MKVDSSIQIGAKRPVRPQSRLKQTQQSLEIKKMLKITKQAIPTTQRTSKPVSIQS